MLKFGLKQYIPLAAILSFATVASAATAYINQVGYRPGDAKEIALVDGNGNVEITDANGTTVLTATPSTASNWAPSGQSVQLGDISDLKIAGTYSIKVGGQVVRSDLKVSEKTYEDVVKASLVETCCWPYQCQRATSQFYRRIWNNQFDKGLVRCR